MAVILSILKLIGIILLALLGVLILTVGVILFVPIHYQISGQIEDEIEVHAKITWLLHLISFTLDYREKQATTCLRLFGLRKDLEKKSALDDIPDDDENETSETHIESTDVESAFTESDENTSEQWDVEKDESQIPDEDLKRRDDGIFSRIRVLIRNIIDTVNRIREGVPQILDKISEIKGLLTDEVNKFVVIQILGELKYLLNHFRFRTLDTDLRFSTGDPALTGQALGIMSMFPILYLYQVGIVPDFESEEFYVKGTFEIKGRVRGVHFVISLLRLIMQKEVRSVIKKFLDR